MEKFIFCTVSLNSFGQKNPVKCLKIAICGGPGHVFETVRRKHCRKSTKKCSAKIFSGKLHKFF